MEKSQASPKIDDGKLINKTHNIAEHKSSNRRILISIRPKAPILKTLYTSERNRFIQEKNSDRCGSRLGIGDHSSFTSHYSFENTNFVNTASATFKCFNSLKPRKKKKYKNRPKELKSSYTTTDNPDVDISQNSTKIINGEETCTTYSPAPQITMTFPKIENSIFNSNLNKLEIDSPPTAKLFRERATLFSNVVKKIYKRINYLEEKIEVQEMVLGSINQQLNRSSNEESNDKKKYKGPLKDEQPGCSYIEYSRIPETSAFQRPSQQTTPLYNTKATTMDKEHHSERCGRDFKLYDSVNTKNRRQSASVPCKRNEAPKYGAERVHKIRHKLNPVRDYRLMDTVHYLAQGEFAPRDDGIKLTPSREAVLSDIIWEDVCRTHWPNTRLARRAAHTERCSTRSDLQSLIDSLLRERVAHIERRKRRHYRVVKLNHRVEAYKPLGKIGDIIVASNKNNQNCANKNSLSDNDNSKERSRIMRSREKTMNKAQKSRQNECSPGPSSAIYQESTCCYHAGKTKSPNVECDNQNKLRERSSISSDNTNKNPRFVINKNSSHRRHRSNEPNLEHFILLPTLVVRTPSNVRRQKKFNELYHRILNVQIKKAQTKETDHIANDNEILVPARKDIGLNVNILWSESEEFSK